MTDTLRDQIAADLTDLLDEFFGKRYGAPIEACRDAAFLATDVVMRDVPGVAAALATQAAVEDWRAEMMRNYERLCELAALEHNDAERTRLEGRAGGLWWAVTHHDVAMINALPAVGAGDEAPK